MLPSRTRTRRFVRHALALATLAAALLHGDAAHSARAAFTAGWADPLAPMVRRTDDYLQAFKANGVTMDWRYSVIPSEEIRQTVVCQLLAYVELAHLDPRPRLRDEILQHGDFLLGRIDSIRSYTPFDGMLAYSLLEAYDVTRQDRYMTAATQITNDLIAIPTSECILNGGLMVAMATAEYAHLTGDAVALQKTHDIITQLVPYQNADGSFPHWCYGSRDIHYTGWMGMELVHIGRLLADSHIEPFLSSMTGFLAGRIAPNGQAVYEEPCPGVPGCTEYFYSRATGCPQDLDSRGWTVEPAYCALMFDREGSVKYQPVMTFLDSLENGGTIPDLYGYWPPPSDPEYPWTTADTSVVCMSINLWVLSTAIAEREARGVPVDLVLDDIANTIGNPPPGGDESHPLAVEPNPAKNGCVLRYALSAPRRGTLRIYDAGGRLVRTLESGTLAAGAHAPPWDGRDDAGRAVPEGVYFAYLRTDAGLQTRRLTLLR